MSPRHPVRALTLLATTTYVLLLTSGTALAQPDIPPPINDIKNGRPWTYDFGWMITWGALAMLAAIVVGYLVKSRDFRANQRRGGSK
jgi:hypothetical protein